MNVLKNLAVVRRRNRSSSVVSDDGLDDEAFCYHQQHNQVSDGDTVDDTVDGGTVGADGAREDSDNSGSLMSLYGRRRNTSSPAASHPPVMNVVTSTKFDSDEAFSMVAGAMIHRYEHENKSEREAIHAVLASAEDTRAFIEALDLRFISLSADETDGDDAIDDAFSEIIIRARSLFYVTLQALWREKESQLSTPGKEDDADRDGIMVEEDLSDHDEYRKQHPKAPKNLRMSPMQTSFGYKNRGTISQNGSYDSASSEVSNTSNIFQPFKRRRRWFFAENKKERLHKPFPIKATLPNFHFDFGTNNANNGNSNTKLIFVV
mmetsp:Transcript_23695/g.50403  ORF Transcript_23695/g.50403 Transcript_23695/m.50403 type:complete len:320 (+) Transcript_23695:17-976(+)